MLKGVVFSSFYRIQTHCLWLACVTGSCLMPGKTLEFEPMGVVTCISAVIAGHHTV